METKTIKIDFALRNAVINKHEIFKWNVTNEVIEGKNIIISFERDETIPNYEEIKKLEEQYGPVSLYPFFPTLILCGISILLMTTFIIVYLVLNSVEKFLLCFFSFMIPGIFFLMLAVLYTFLRMKQINYLVNKIQEKENLYRKKVSSLK